MRDALRFLAVLLAVLPALARCGGAPKETPKGKAPVEEGRFVEFPFYNEQTGELEWKVLAAKVTADPANARILHGTDVRILVYHKGQTQRVKAKKGVVDTATRSATLEGDVVMDLMEKVGLPTRVETDDLDWDSKNSTASTKGPVKIARPDMVVTGTGMRLWLTEIKEEKKEKAERTGELVIERRVRTDLLPGSNASLLEAPAAMAPEPIIITNDGSLNLSRSEPRAVFRDNVRATQGKRSLACDLLTVGMRPAPGERGKVALESALATGQVRLDDVQTVALADSAEWQREEGSMKLLGRPAEVRWDNGNRLVAGLIHRMGDGAELLCTGTPEYPRDVYLLAYAVDRTAQDDEKREPYQLSPRDILDWRAFCATLAKQAAAKAPSPGKRLWEFLPVEVQGILQSVAEGNVLGQQRKARITNLLNGILKRADFCLEADLPGAALPPAAAELLKHDRKMLNEAQVTKLNRLLLDAAFPGLVAKAEPAKGAGERK